MPTVLVPASRLERWVLNFNGRHGATALATAEGSLTGAASDGSTFVAHLPLGERYTGLPEVAGFAAAARELPDAWGVLLVRKGGFAVARLSGDRIVESKVGQRHVQGRTKAGGQSQQRFARRRDNQARQAYEAAADHAARILGDLRGPVVAGGDRSAVHEVLEDPRLRDLRPVEPWLPVPDPRRSVLDEAVGSATALRIDVVNAGE